ncbi:MAG: hypothetical protein ACOY71_03580 [Gemmatimonadota bacterium]
MLNRIIAALVTLALLGCETGTQRASTHSGQPTVVAFDSLFLPIHSVRVPPDSADPLASPVALDAARGEVALADPRQGNVKVFDPVSGRLIRAIGRPGDGPGEFRRPAGVSRWATTPVAVQILRITGDSAWGVTVDSAATTLSLFRLRLPGTADDWNLELEAGPAAAD